MEPSEVDPILADMPSGYSFRVSDAHFAGYTAEAVRHCLDQQLPLGVSASAWLGKVANLEQRLVVAGYTDWDVRLQGTMAYVESGNPEKTFPQSLREAREQITAAYAKDDEYAAYSKGRTMVARQRTAIRSGTARWRATYGRRSAGEFPRRHFMDSRYTLTGLDHDRSDLDMQLSSQWASWKVEHIGLQRLQQESPIRFAAVIAQRLSLVEACWEAYNQREVFWQLRHPKYGFYNDEFVVEACPELVALQDEWSVELQREVVVKVFSTEGPALPGTRFDDRHDWIVTQHPVRSQ